MAILILAVCVLFLTGSYYYKQLGYRGDFAIELKDPFYFSSVGPRDNRIIAVAPYEGVDFFNIGPNVRAIGIIDGTIGCKMEDTNGISWYLISMEKKQKYGPLTFQEYEKKCHELGLHKSVPLGSWNDYPPSAIIRGEIHSKYKDEWMKSINSIILKQ